MREWIEPLPAAATGELSAPLWRGMSRRRTCCCAGWPIRSSATTLACEPSRRSNGHWPGSSARTDLAVQAFAIFAEEQHVGNVVFDRIDRYLGSARLSIYVGEAAARGARSAQRRCTWQWRKCSNDPRCTRSGSRYTTGITRPSRLYLRLGSVRRGRVARRVPAGWTPHECVLSGDLEERLRGACRRS